MVDERAVGLLDEHLDDEIRVLGQEPHRLRVVEPVPKVADGDRLARGLGLDGPAAEMICPVVSRVAGVLGASWHTAHDGFVRVADQAGIVLTDPVEAAEADQADPPAEADREPANRESAGPGPGRSVSRPLPEVGVLGLDDHRRGSTTTGGARRAGTATR
ncbi:hypothetical protein [Pseudofrankia sp. DC12]|uniref:hypothetical protein n=1 Tax=Pseudofrankia sp. DC12 TaxID=683315 RepID=UPI0012FB0C70|nr:hypothetical protein [Pseudofrankia sp. DC12]